MMPNVVINVVPEPGIYLVADNSAGAHKLAGIPGCSIMFCHKADTIKKSEKYEWPKPDRKNFRRQFLGWKPS